MVNDSKAEALETKGLYRRAATRWGELLRECLDEGEREWIKTHIDLCVANSRQPATRADDFGDVHRAAKETQNRMGIAQPNGNAFRLPAGRKRGR